MESLSFPSFFSFNCETWPAHALDLPEGQFPKSHACACQRRLCWACPPARSSYLPPELWQMPETPLGGRSELSARPISRETDPRLQTEPAWSDADSTTTSPSNQKNAHELITTSPLNPWLDKNSSLPFRSGHSFEGVSLLWISLPSKVIKLFFTIS